MRIVNFRAPVCLRLYVYSCDCVLLRILIYAFTRMLMRVVNFRAPVCLRLYVYSCAFVLLRILIYAFTHVFMRIMNFRTPVGVPYIYIRVTVFFVLWP